MIKHHIHAFSYKESRKEPGSVPRGSTSASSRSSARLPGLDPPPEDIDPVIWPAAVAGHGSCAHLGEDGIRVPADIVVGPEVEDEAHRLPVHGSEQRPDVLLEAHRLVLPG